MIRAIIIDDEHHVREDIRSLLGTYFEDAVHIIAEASSVKEGIQRILTLNPQLIFLDIDLGDGTGFELLSQLPNKNFELIFITGFDQHAIQALRVGALDYILKPISEDEFIVAVKKAIINQKKESSLDKLIEVSNDYFNRTTKKRIVLRDMETIHAVYEDDIIYCKADGGYTIFHTRQNEKIVISKSLKKVQELLSEAIFVRCHQSYIINKKYVFKYDKKGFLLLEHNIKVPVSVRRKDHTLKKVFQ